MVQCVERRELLCVLWILHIHSENDTETVKPAQSIFLCIRLFIARNNTPTHIDH